jgi:hypothetical protein
MAAKPELVPPAPDKPKPDWTAKEKEFFDSEGVTDDKEKAAIRGRARVHAYDRARQKFENESSKPDDKPDDSKPWYKD